MRHLPNEVYSVAQIACSTDYSFSQIIHRI